MNKGLSRRETLGTIAAAVAITASAHPLTALAQITTKESIMKTKAFVYTKLQNSVPFTDVPWNDLSALIAKEPGFLNKTWFSGVGTIENALTFAIEDFPKTTARMNAAFYTRIFDANTTESASRGLNSPFYA